MSPQLVGLALVLYGIYSIPRDLIRLKTAALPHGWSSTRRPSVVLGWHLIIAGFLIAGALLIVAGWSAFRPVLVIIGLTMFTFLLVPCQFAYFNGGRRRWARNTLFVLLGLAAWVVAQQPRL